MLELVCGALVVLALVLGGLLARSAMESRRLRDRYAPLITLDDEIKLREDALGRVRAEFADVDTAHKKRVAELARQYGESKALYDRLRQEVALLEENLEDISVGLYKPHFTYATSEEFKRKLEQVREQRKVLVHGDRAIHFAKAWLVGNSRKEGERMQKQYGKLLLRAFNGEVDAAIAKVSWNNVLKMEERIRKAHEAINKLGGVMEISIVDEYLRLSLDELRLEHELEDKRHDEQEEQRRIKEQIREEERAQREANKAREAAEAEESRYEKALKKAQDDLLRAKGAEHDALTSKIAELQRQLDEAHKAKERAISMAQLTKAGHVYIISNVGSFGDNVVKIGMTRRLEPMDRVRELGDASVPFEFDVHAMVYSENAPGLENELHKKFHERRVNLVNLRKEFFKVSLDELAGYVRERGLKLELTMLAEAREYRETLGMRERHQQPPLPPTRDGVEFPDAMGE